MDADQSEIGTVDLASGIVLSAEMPLTVGRCGPGAGGLTKTEVELYLSGANDYTGDTTIGAGEPFNKDIVYSTV